MKATLPLTQCTLLWMDAQCYMKHQQFRSDLLRVNISIQATEQDRFHVWCPVSLWHCKLHCFQWMGIPFLAAWNFYKDWLSERQVFNTWIFSIYFYFFFIVPFFVWIFYRNISFVVVLLILVYAHVFVLSVCMPYYSTNSSEYFPFVICSMKNSFPSRKCNVVLRVYS